MNAVESRYTRAYDAGVRLDANDTPMTDASYSACTRNSRFIKASREAIYRAFIDPVALVVWLPPEEMTGKVHNFDARVGGRCLLLRRKRNSKPQTTHTAT